MELDIFLPTENLVFEYQGKHHYFDVYVFGNLLEKTLRDKEKKNACLEFGLTLIEVPYWWDKNSSSLLAVIKQKRIDLFQKINLLEGVPIPLHPPEGFP